MKIKRFCAIAAVAALFAAGATGCSCARSDDQNETDAEIDKDAVVDEANEDVALYLTDGRISGSDVVMTVNGDDITAGYLIYWLAYAITNHGYVESSELSAQLGNGTVADAVMGEARDYAIYYTVIDQKAQEYGLTLSQEQEAELTDQLVASDESTLLFSAMQDLEIQESVIRSDMLRDALYDLLVGEQGTYAPTDDEIAAYITENEYMTVDYMIFWDVPGNTEGKDEALERAESVYENLDMDYLDESFAALEEQADFVEYDYTFCRGEANSMMFEAAEAMDPGDAQVVESGHGYYLVVKKELSDVAGEYASKAIADVRFDDLSSGWIDDAQIVVNDHMDSIDPASVCDQLFVLQDAVYNQMLQTESGSE